MDRSVVYKRNRKVVLDALNVDVVYSIFGVSDPPELPLRQELLTQGVELVHNAKGVGQKAVCKEQKKREEKLLRKIKRIERKLEKKRSQQRSRKREKAIAMVRDLRIRMEHCARTISYEVYIEELRKANEHYDEILIDGNSCSGDGDSLDIAADCTNHDGSVNTHAVENRLLEALEMWNEKEQGLDHGLDLSDGESLIYTDDDSFDSLLSVDTTATAEVTDISMETRQKHETNEDIGRRSISRSVHTSSIEKAKYDNEDFPVSYEHGEGTSDSDQSEEETVSPIWAKVNIDRGPPLSSKAHPNLPRSPTTSTWKGSPSEKESDESLPTIVKSSSSSSVRFKDVKPTVEDNLARARALIQNAKVVQKSFSDEKTIKTSDTHAMNSTTSNTNIIHSNESRRYHLFVCHACPWSHRTLVVRTLKGLESVIGVSYLECSWKPRAHADISTMINPDNDVSFWSIESESGDQHDDVFQAFKEIYLKQNHATCTRVPVLWDNHNKNVVGTSSTEIMWMLNFDFNKWANQPKINLFPHGKKMEHDEINRWLHRSLFAGVYRCGLATNQRQYDEAIQDLTDALDRVEEIVAVRGFLVGDEITASDVRLFVVLIRFDEIYRILFKTNTRRVSGMTGIMEYLKDIYNVKGMKDTCDFSAMKRQYFGANSQGKECIIPRGGIFQKLILDESDSSN